MAKRGLCPDPPPAYEGASHHLKGNGMECANCSVTKDQHPIVEGARVCVGSNTLFRQKINNLKAVFLYNNDRGMAKSDTFEIIVNQRQINNVDNIIIMLLRMGNTDISVNLEVY